MKIKFLILLGSLIAAAQCAENSVSINVKNVANTISDRFISFEINFCDLMNLYLEQKSMKNLSLISPAYVKLRGFSAYLKSGNNDEFNGNDVAALMESLNSLQITPVIVIDYDTTTFEPVRLLHELKAARNLKINNCVWQLGHNKVGFESNESLKRYVDDLKTLKILCESVKREYHLNWNVAAVGNTLKSLTENFPFDVVGYEVKTISTNEILTNSPSFFPKLQTPLWATIENSSTEFSATESSSKAVNACDHECLINGLLHAQMLGTAAKTGLDVLFFDESLNSSMLCNSNVDFKKAVTILHKKLVGTKSFNVRVTKSLSDGKLSNLYSHCSKKTEGALTLMGINFSNMRSKFNVKLTTSTDSNAMILQYLLSASDGHVLLNNGKFNVDSAPSYKYKKHSKFSISLVLPPFSMAFWTIKNVKVNACLNVKEESSKEITKESQMTSTDKLLKKLVTDEFGGKKTNAIEKKPRSKRQIGGGGAGQYLPSTFDFDLPVFKFPNLMTSASNTRPIKDILFKNSEVYKQPSADVNPLQSSENPTLPRGDVYMMVNDGSTDFVDTLDVIVDDAPKKYKQVRKKGNNKIVYRETTEEAPEYFIPYDYFEASHKPTKTSPKKASKKVEQPREVGELFEVERQTSALSRGVDQIRSPSQDIELKTVIRELEPTYRQSKTALNAAKRKWDRSQIMDLLRDAQLEEVDRSRLAEADDFEVIDLTNNGDGEAPNYDEYEDEDDGFFSEDKMHVRTRRHVNYAKNEIPKYGSHDMIDEDGEDSIESLMDDVHLYFPPQSSRDSQSNSDSFQMTAPILTSTQPPMTVKAINFVSQSLNQVINVLDKTLVGWWYVFNPKETS